MRPIREGRTAGALASALALLAALALAAAPALADKHDPLVEAKKAGWVGELPNGYLGIVDPKAPAEARELVERINAKRRALYEGVADRNEVPVGQVEAVAGEKLRQRAAEGLFVQDADGKWVRKKEPEAPSP